MAHWLQCLHVLLCISIYFALSLAKQKRQSSRKRVKVWRGEGAESWPQSGVCACVSGGKCAAGPQRRDSAAADSKSAGLVPRMEDGWQDGSSDCSDHRLSAASESTRIKTRLRENSYSRQKKKKKKESTDIVTAPAAFHSPPPHPPWSTALWPRIPLLFWLTVRAIIHREKTRETLDSAGDWLSQLLPPMKPPQPPRP